MDSGAPIDPIAMLERSQAAANRGSQAEASVASDRPMSKESNGPAEEARLPTPRVIAIVNRKGGVGKTTTSFNLAGALSERTGPVLLIDLDPMGSLCRSLNIRPSELPLSDLLVGLQGSLGQLIRPTEIPHLYCIPGDPNLRTFEMRNGPSVGYRNALRQHLAGVLKLKPFPFVIIDCPPSLGLISGNALVACSEVIIPVDGSIYGMGALVDTLRVIKLVRSNANPTLSVCGLLLNNVDMGTMYDRTVLEVLQRQYRSLVFKSVIPASPESDVCSQMGKPVTRHAPSSWMAKAYRQLTDEILARRPQRVG